MRSVVASILLTVRASFRDRAALQLEILALRHQLQVVNRSRQRLRITNADQECLISNMIAHELLRADADDARRRDKNFAQSKSSFLQHEILQTAVHVGKKDVRTQSPSLP
jgi:hypothetical protein